MTLAKVYHYNGPGQGLILAGVVLIAVLLSIAYWCIKSRQTADILARRDAERRQ